ncbi:DUF2339 domain-containing protein [bacterium]|nr:DUF2339 domain-containing protein [bacterium]
MAFWVFIALVISIIAIIKSTGKIGQKDFEQKISQLYLEIDRLKQKPDSAIPPDSVQTEVKPDKTPEKALASESPAPSISVNIPPPAASTTPRSIPVIPRKPDPVTTFIKNFFTGGNLVFRIGGIVLFLGIVFLVKYVSDRGLFPIEYRLAMAALMALGLLGLGWFLRKKGQYGLFLQGLGLAVFYLTIFASYRLYHLIPAGFTFTLLVITVVISVLLSVVQRNKAMAITGFLGGFMAPILASTGSGNHVALFGYYAVLNLGILGVAYYQSWRVLNLIGFFFTYGVGTIWGFKYYTPQNFSTTEPFILLFFTIFFAVSILFAIKKTNGKSNPVDATLVFGTPLITIFYQSLVFESNNALAIFSILLSALYITVGRLMWNKYAETLKLIVQGFVALGIGFFTLAVPLALDKSATSIVWVIEGCGVAWMGLKQARILPRLAGFLLIIMGSIRVIELLTKDHGHTLFVNEIFVVFLILAIGHLFFSYQYFKNKNVLKPGETFFYGWCVFFGHFWFNFIFIFELSKHISFAYLDTAILIFIATSILFWQFVSVILKWENIKCFVPLVFPASVIGMVIIVGDHFYSLPQWHVVLSLAACLLAQSYYLYKNDGTTYVKLLMHALNLYAVFLFVGHLFQIVQMTFKMQLYAADESLFMFKDKYYFGPILAFILSSFTIVKLSHKNFWPFAQKSNVYMKALNVVTAVLLVWFFLIIPHHSGVSVLLNSYLPFLNFADLFSVAIIMLLFYWIKRSEKNGIINSKQKMMWMSCVGISIFVFLNLVLARTISFYTELVYSSQVLLQTPLFQALMSLLWTCFAMVLMLGGTKNKSRLIWQVGVALLLVTVIKLVGVDMKRIDSLYRIIAFMGSGMLILVVGYFSPLPPKQEVKNV